MRSFTVVGVNTSSRTTKFIVLVDGRVLYDSGITGLAEIKIDLPLKRSKLELVVDAAGDHAFDQSYWCFPRFHRKPVEQLTDAELDGKKPSTPSFNPGPESTASEGRVTRNQALEGTFVGPPHFRSLVPCDEFLFTHAPSSVTFAIPPGMTRFTAIGYNVRSQHTRFQVWADKNLLYESPQAGITPITVRLPPNARELELKVTDLEDRHLDHAMWCYPRLHAN